MCSSASSSLGTALIVDEAQVNRLLLRHALHTLGYQAKEAADGSEALRLINEALPAVLFLSWDLSGEPSPYQVLRHLLAQPNHAGTLLIALSGATGSTLRQTSLRAGAHAFLGPSFDLNSINSALFKARSHVAAQSAPPPPSRLHQNLAVLASSRAGDMAETLRYCRAELTSELDRLRTAITASQWTDAARAAHNLGSMGALIDMPDLHRTARATEAVLRGGDSLRLPALLAETEQALAEALRTLSDLTG
jgi:two-component system, cell cycle response regulator DivK